MCLQCTKCQSIYYCQKATQKLLKEKKINLSEFLYSADINLEFEACKKPTLITEKQCIKCNEKTRGYLELRKTKTMPDPEWRWRDMITTIVVLNFDIAEFYKTYFKHQDFPKESVRIKVD